MNRASDLRITLAAPHRDWPPAGHGPSHGWRWPGGAARGTQAAAQAELAARRTRAASSARVSCDWPLSRCLRGRDPGPLLRVGALAPGPPGPGLSPETAAGTP